MIYCRAQKIHARPDGSARQEAGERPGGGGVFATDGEAGRFSVRRIHPDHRGRRGTWPGAPRRRRGWVRQGGGGRGNPRGLCAAPRASLRRRVGRAGRGASRAAPGRRRAGRGPVDPTMFYICIYPAIHPNRPRTASGSTGAPSRDGAGQGRAGRWEGVVPVGHRVTPFRGAVHVGARSGVMTGRRLRNDTRRGLGSPRFPTISLRTRSERRLLEYTS